MEQMIADGEAAELSTPQRELSPKQLIALQAFMAGKSTATAGQQAGRCARTVQLGMQQPTFRQALREGR